MPEEEEEAAAGLVYVLPGAVPLRCFPRRPAKPWAGSALIGCRPARGDPTLRNPGCDFLVLPLGLRGPGVSLPAVAC